MEVEGGGRREERGWGSWGRLDGYIWGGGMLSCCGHGKEQNFFWVIFLSVAQRVQRAETDWTTETQRPCLSNASESPAGVQLSMTTFNPSVKLHNQQTDLSSVMLNELQLHSHSHRQCSHSCSQQTTVSMLLQCMMGNDFEYYGAVSNPEATETVTNCNQETASYGNLALKQL